VPSPPRFLLFDPTGESWPAVSLPQVAFAGRSNVGNFADLPGYGFARVSREERNAWKVLVEGYFSTCRMLRKVYLLVDIRRGPEEEERMLAEYLSSLRLPYRWVGMKVDKVKPREIAVLSSRFTGSQWLDEGGPVALVSARKRTGIDLLWRDIRAVFSS
jgi:GTP-binding protein